MKKLNFKNIGFTLLAVLVLIQFIPTAKNNGEAFGENDIAHVVTVPADVQEILKESCNDCHSNHTDYPWYSKVQPVGFWLNDHVNEGKHELNFSEFATYKKKRQLHKLDEVVEMIDEHEMPLSSYTLIHKNAVLSSEQQYSLVNWAKQAKVLLQDSTAQQSHL
ncbi:MAG: heme-binding domain-containing protein [Bacteroidota bacterium]